MRLALITRKFPPECCGVGDYTARLAETWKQLGHEVTVFVAGNENQEQPEARAFHVERIRLDGRRDIEQAVEAICKARPERVQIEYSNYAWSQWGFAFYMNALVRALRRRGVPVTTALHEFPLDIAQHPLLAGLSLVQWLHFAELVHGSEEVLTNTRERVRILQRWFPWRREAIRFRPNSSNIPVAAGGTERRAELRTLHAPAGAIVLATFGTYHRDKNFEAVVEAAAAAQSEQPVALWLLGDSSPAQPEYREKLRGLICRSGLEAATWQPGRMNAEEISHCLAAADVFVLPQPDGQLTRSGSFMAAAAHGLPVIAVRNTENQTDFAHGENVWLVDASRGELILAAIRLLAGDAALRGCLGKNLRALYEREFSWTTAVTPWEHATNAAEVVHADV
jgi:glycosyltransferase involved in cell wall biosynthesis